MMWRIVKQDMTRDYDCTFFAGTVLQRLPDQKSLHMFQPDTNPADALSVLKKCAEKLKDTQFQIAVCIDPDDGKFIVTVDSADDRDDAYCAHVVAIFPTLEESICSFALKLFEK